MRQRSVLVKFHACVLGIDDRIGTGLVICRKSDIRTVGCRGDAQRIAFALEAAVLLLYQKSIVIADAGLEHEIEIKRDKDSGECDNGDDALFFAGLPDAGQHKDTPI